jgi:hypothetical protein
MHKIRRREPLGGEQYFLIFSCFLHDGCANLRPRVLLLTVQRLPQHDLTFSSPSGQRPLLAIVAANGFCRIVEVGQ